MEAKLSFKVKIVKKITDIPRDQWEKVFPDCLESYDFFRTLDESNFYQFNFFYLVVYDEAVAVGATSCFTMRFSLDMTVSGGFKKILDTFKKIAPNLLSPKVLMCGLPMGQGRIGVFKDPEKVIRAVELAMESIATQEKASLIIFKDFSGDYNPLLEPLLPRGFSRIESLPSTDMDLSFSSFEEYLLSLSPVSRSGVKRKFKKIDQEAALDLEVVDSLDDCALSQVHELYLQTMRKHKELSLEEVPRDFFKNISHNMPGKVKYFLWGKEGKIVAFAFCLVSPKLFIDYYLGFDYALAYQQHLYFIRFRDLLNWCISRGIKKYEMGATGYEVKRRLGFRFIRLYFYMKHRNAFFNFFLALFKGFFAPEKFDPVFKEIKRSEEQEGRLLFERGQN